MNRAAFAPARAILPLALLLASALNLWAQTPSLSPTGTVAVVPTGQATVYLDGVRVKVARPNERVVAPRVEVGRHIVEVRGNGFENYLTMVTVVAGQEAVVQAQLLPRGDEIKLTLPAIRDYKDPLKDVSAEDRAVFARAEQLTRNLEYTAARSTLAPVLAKDPANAVSSYYLANTYLEEAANCGCEEEEQRMANLRLAYPKLERGLGKSRPFAWSLVGMARYHAVLKEFAKVKEFALRALELKGDDVDVLVALADVYLLTRSRAGIDEATNVLSKAELINGNRADVQTTLGDTWLQQGVTEIALQKYQRALEVDPRQVRAHYRLGQYYREQRKYQDAAAALKKAVEIDPKFAPAYVELGEVWFRAKQYAAAKENYRKYVELRGNDRTARYRYAQFLYLAQDYPGAVTEIKALQKDTSSNLLYRLLAYSSYEAGNVAEAKAAMTTYFQNIKQEFVIARDYEYRGKIALKDGRVDEGLSDLERALAMDPTRDDLFADAIRACAANKQPQRGLGIARRAVAAEPSLQNYVSLAGALRLQPRATRADSVAVAQSVDSAFAKACELAPRDMRWALARAENAFVLDPETESGVAKPLYENVQALAEKDPTRFRKELLQAYRYLGYCHYNALKDNTKATEYWEKALAIDPNLADVKQLMEYVKGQKK